METFKIHGFTVVKDPGVPPGLMRLVPVDIAELCRHFHVPLPAPQRIAEVDGVEIYE